MFGMKTYLINMHLLVPRSRSSAKVKVKYKGYISQKMAVSGAFVFHKYILFLDEICITVKVFIRYSRNVEIMKMKFFFLKINLIFCYL